MDLARRAARLLALAALVLAPLAARAATPATTFSLRDLDGNTVELDDYKGKVIFLDFWATWCGPCKDAMPHWQKMYTDLKSKGLVVLAVSTDDARSKPRVKPFIRSSGYTYPVLFDTDSSALMVYDPNKTLPFSVLIGRDFQLHDVHAGYTPGDEKKVRAEVEKLLAEPAPGAPAPAAEPAPAPVQP